MFEAAVKRGLDWSLAFGVDILSICFSIVIKICFVVGANYSRDFEHLGNVEGAEIDLIPQLE